MWSSAGCGSRGSPSRYGCWRPAAREILAAPPDGEPEETMDELTVGIAALERTPLFAGLDREDLQQVLGCRQRVSFERGQAIVERWDPGDAMYIIVSGAAEVDVGGRFFRLERGDFFGEMAVLASQRREAAVKAVEPVEALRIPATANEQDVRVLRGGCVPLGEEGLPFAPVTAALRGLAGKLDPAELEAVAGPARADLGRLLPDLAWGAGAAAAAAVGAGGAGASQGRLFELLLGVVERLAATAPLLLVMEDLHWADRSTRDLVAFLVAYLRSGRVLLALTFRSDELHRLHPLRGLLGELARNRRVQRLDLPRFTRAELAEQLAGLLGADPPAGLVEDIYARSEGNPFFAEELVLAGDGTGPGALPPSLQEVLLTRVVRLGRGTQQVLRVAAAAGPGVTQPVLAVVTGMGEAELLGSLREAVDQQVLLPEPGGAAMSSAMHWSPRRSTASCSPASGSACTRHWRAPWRPAPVLESRGRPRRRSSPTTGRQPVTSREP